MDIDIKKFVSEEEMRRVVDCINMRSPAALNQTLAEGWVTLPVILWPERTESDQYRFVRILAYRRKNHFRRHVHIRAYQEPYGFFGNIPPPIPQYLKAMLITDPFEQVKVMEGWRRYVR